MSQIFNESEPYVYHTRGESSYEQVYTKPIIPRISLSSVATGLTMGRSFSRDDWRNSTPSQEKFKQLQVPHMDHSSFTEMEADRINAAFPNAVFPGQSDHWDTTKSWGGSYSHSRASSSWEAWGEGPPGLSPPTMQEDPSRFCIDIEEPRIPDDLGRPYFVPRSSYTLAPNPASKLISVRSRESSADPKPRSSSSSGAAGHKRTTVMIRNIPSGYKQDELIEEVSHFGLKINFAYLPCKQSAGNAGFAFLNFLCPQDATDFIKCFRGHVFVRQTGVKRAKVMFAKVQGLEANVSRHEGTKNSKPWILHETEPKVGSTEPQITAIPQS